MTETPIGLNVEAELYSKKTDTVIDDSCVIWDEGKGLFIEFDDYDIFIKKSELNSTVLNLKEDKDKTIEDFLKILKRRYNDKAA